VSGTALERCCGVLLQFGRPHRSRGHRRPRARATNTHFAVFGSASRSCHSGSLPGGARPRASIASGLDASHFGPYVDFDCSGDDSAGDQAIHRGTDSAGFSLRRHRVHRRLDTLEHGSLPLRARGNGLAWKPRRTSLAPTNLALPEAYHYSTGMGNRIVNSLPCPRPALAAVTKPP
jgi:hypothetical protein